MIEQIEDTFKKLDSKIETLRKEWENVDHVEIPLIDSSIVTNELNNARNYMLSRMRKQRDSNFEKLKNDTSMDSEKLKMDMIYFIAGTQNLFACELAGSVRAATEILSRIQFLHLLPHPKTIHLPRLETSNLTYYRNQNINSDLLIPYSLEKIFYARSNGLEATSNSYDLEIKNFLANQDYLSKREHLSSIFDKSFKLEFCQIDYELNRVIVFFENKYQKDYELKFYDLVNLNLIRSVTLNHSLQRLLCYTSEILLHYWDDDYNINIKFFNSNFQPILHDVEFDESIFGKFYSIDDFNEEFLLVHGQKEIGIICRHTRQLIRQKNVEDCLDSKDNARDSLHLMANNNQFEERAKFEYLNLKLFKDFAIVATWSKILIFDSSTLCLYAKNDIYFIRGHNWYFPNRMYLSKKGDLVFYDSTNLLLTFV